MKMEVMRADRALDLRGLAIRAVSSPLWRWLPGTLTRHEGRFWTFIHRNAEPTHSNYTPFHRVSGAGNEPVMPVLPDFSDPATLGCLLHLVRLGWGDPAGHIVRRDSVELPFGFLSDGEVVAYGKSEPAALVSALERAYSFAKGLSKKDLDFESRQQDW